MKVTICRLVGGFAMLGLMACSEAGPEIPVPPPPEPVPAEVAVPSGSAASTSVPDAASVFTPAAETKTDPAAGRSNNTMSRTEESTAMPLPGQNNDHSAPLPPAKRASSP
jgi:hypothetical protein